MREVVVAMLGWNQDSDTSKIILDGVGAGHYQSWDELYYNSCPGALYWVTDLSLVCATVKSSMYLPHVVRMLNEAQKCLQDRVGSLGRYDHFDFSTFRMFKVQSRHFNLDIDILVFCVK